MFFRCFPVSRRRSSQQKAKRSSKVDPEKLERDIKEAQDRRAQHLKKVREDERIRFQDVQIRDKILSLNLLELQEALQRGKYTAMQTLCAFAWKAIEENDRLNCLCDFIMESFDEAQYLDRLYSSGENAKPPLFGLPFSVKNGFQMRGYDWSVGVASWLKNPIEGECTFIEHLRKLGAIPFVVTNCSQFLLSHFTMNPVYGITGNPMNPMRSPGGSSGGDAALKGAGGSAFATGSDLGGSVRIPAVMCGLCSLKPTKGRYVPRWLYSGVPGCRAISAVCGFMVSSVEELVLLWKSALADGLYHREFAPESVPMPLDVAKIKEYSSGGKKLRIGYYVDDGFIPVIPAMQRAVREVVEKLDAEGHTLVEFHFPNAHRVVEMMMKLFMFDNIKEMFKNGEPYVKCGCEGQPPVVPKKDSDSMIKRMYSNARETCSEYLRSKGLKIIDLFPQVGANSVEEYRLTQLEAENYTANFTKQWQSLKLDALVCPAFYYPALDNCFAEATSSDYPAFATGFYNLVNFPAGIVPPVGRVTAQDDDDLKDETKWPTTGAHENFLKILRYAARNCKGLPITVQVVGLPWEEEVVLGVMGLIQKLTVKAREGGFRPPLPVEHKK